MSGDPLDLSESEAQVRAESRGQDLVQQYPAPVPPGVDDRAAAGRRWYAENGWVCEKFNGCTCGGSGILSPAHQPGCGLVPLTHVGENAAPLVAEHNAAIAARDAARVRVVELYASLAAARAVPSPGGDETLRAKVEALCDAADAHKKREPYYAWVRSSDLRAALATPAPTPEADRG